MEKFIKKKMNLLFTITAVIIFCGILNVNAEDNLTINPNITGIYEYNQISGDANYCITGEESTCKTITSLDNVSGGTIIKYRINDTEEKYFYVLHDDGTTLTMQQRENTINNTPWINSEDYAATNIDGTSCSGFMCNDEGPITVLESLEQATKGWTNVNNQTYTMGTTNFNRTTAYTGCTSGYALLCDTNTYTLGQRIAKARMITMQEAISIGCIDSLNQSCPIWMNNYLSNSTMYGGTVDIAKDQTGEQNSGYWTMSADSSSVDNAWCVTSSGRISYNLLYNLVFSARAVISIDKYGVDDASSEKETIENNNSSNKNDNQIVEVEDTALNVSKIVIFIGILIFIVGIVVITQCYLKTKKK